MEFQQNNKRRRAQKHGSTLKRLPTFQDLSLMTTCWAPNCTHTNLTEACSFFCFIKNVTAAKNWEALLRCIGNTDTNSRVCSCHFWEGLKRNGPEFFQQNTPVLGVHLLENSKSQPSTSATDGSTNRLDIYKCNLCPYETQWRFAADHHWTTHNILSTNLLFSCANKLRHFKCSVCSYDSMCHHKLYLHLYKQHNLERTTTRITRLVIKIEKSNKQETESKWIYCPQCTYFSKQQWRVNRHIREKHSTKNECKCQVCSEIFPNKIKLKIHMLKEHPHRPKGSVFYMHCPQCSYKTNRKDNLEDHIILAHTPDDKINWLSCPNCPFQAKIQCVLDHHTCETQFKTKCADCDYTCQELKLLNLHREQYHFSWCNCPNLTYMKKGWELLKQHIEHRHSNRTRIVIKYRKCIDCSNEFFGCSACLGLKRSVPYTDHIIMKQMTGECNENQQATIEMELQDHTKLDRSSSFVHKFQNPFLTELNCQSCVYALLKA